jgi:hypothetical protein
MQCFKNELAYFATTISYERKIVIKLATGGFVNVSNYYTKGQASYLNKSSRLAAA